MSKRLFAVAALVATAALSTAALAASMTRVGEVKSTDAAKHELVLSTGATFELPAKFNVSSLKNGEKVKVTYEMKDGKMVASHVWPQK
ncbi:MAG: DUF1344 domain-containing protein [Beijerinckiaceae bacterium]